MNFFEEANSKLEKFLKDKLSSYHELRNYDYGIENHSNVSQISKYISHRILLEYDIMKKLKNYDKKKKFTEEILWRLYWRGYLEKHKSIWYEYKNFKETPCNSNHLEKATNGKTGIHCFDTWIDELRGNNYLHNHSRMWFASIWIFTLKLPWQLGAKLFMKYLLDGDAASNTLSWRWVAGLHTNNKPYKASKENINKYTFNRFKGSPINLSKIPIKTSYIKHQSHKLPSIKTSIKSNVLIMFENDLNISNRSYLFNSYSRIYILFNVIIEENSKLSENVIEFKYDLIEYINKLIPNSEIINSIDLYSKLNNLKYIDVIYPGIGNNLDLINKYSKQKNVEINYILREEDLSYWNYADSGFYKFKKSLNEFNLV